MFSIGLWLACAEADTTFLQCDLAFTAPTVGAAPGTEVQLVGGPLTEPYDTILRVSGVDAVVQDVERDCAACDECRAEAGCVSCGACTKSCDETCATECVETLTFVVPEVEAGPTAIVVLNSWGVSPAVPFEVLAAVPPATSTTTP